MIDLSGVDPFSCIRVQACECLPLSGTLRNSRRMTGAGDRDRTGMTFRSRDFKFEKGAWPLWGFYLLFFIFNDLMCSEK